MISPVLSGRDTHWHPWTYKGAIRVPHGRHTAQLRVSNGLDSARNCTIPRGRYMWTCGTPVEPVQDPYKPLCGHVQVFNGLFTISNPHTRPVCTYANKFVRHCTDPLQGRAFFLVFVVVVVNSPWTARDLPVWVRKCDVIGYLTVKNKFIVHPFLESNVGSQRAHDA